MTTQVPVIQVYISYNKVHEDQLDRLEQAFEQYNANQASSYQMQVIYSKNTMNDGDNIVEFMDKIAVAGVVVFLLTKPYFQSPYCWYELIKSYEKGGVDNRSILLPIRFSEFDQDKEIAILKESIPEWKNNSVGQLELSEHLEIAEDEVLERIEAVEAGILKQWFAVDISENNGDKTVQKIEQAVSRVFEQENTKFDAALLKNIKHELSRKYPRKINLTKNIVIINNYLLP